MKHKIFLILGAPAEHGLQAFQQHKKNQASKEIISFEAAGIDKMKYYNLATNCSGLVEESGVVSVVWETEGRVLKTNFQNKRE
jgi:hypothetical protein